MLTVLSFLLAIDCSRQSPQAVEDLGGGQNISNFGLTALNGTRDGERLDVRASYGDGSRALTVALQFKIDPQANLQTGTWSGLGSQGSVKALSVTFLGGQSGPPSIGGRFDLIGTDGKPQYRITIPLQPLKPLNHSL